MDSSIAFIENRKITALKNTVIVGIATAVGFAVHKAFETAPLWKPPLIGFLTVSGPVGWAILGVGAAIVCALLILKIVSRNGKESKLELLERWTKGRVVSAMLTLPVLVTALGNLCRAIKIFMADKDSEKAKNALFVAEIFACKFLETLKDAICAPSFEKVYRAKYRQRATLFQATLNQCGRSLRGRLDEADSKLKRYYSEEESSECNIGRLIKPI